MAVDDALTFLYIHPFFCKLFGSKEGAIRSQGHPYSSSNGEADGAKNRVSMPDDSRLNWQRI